MATEILGFLIIAGALVYIMSRRSMKLDTSAEDLEATATKFRYEMEQSADEIIGRLTEHVDRLEELIGRADAATKLLENQLAEFRHQMAISENVTISSAGRTAVAKSKEFSHFLSEAAAEDETNYPTAEDSEFFAESAEQVPAQAIPQISRQIDYHKYMKKARQMRMQAPGYPDEGVEMIAPVERKVIPSIKDVTAVSDSYEYDYDDEAEIGEITLPSLKEPEVETVKPEKDTPAATYTPSRDEISWEDAAIYEPSSQGQPISSDSEATSPLQNEENYDTTTDDGWPTTPLNVAERSQTVEWIPPVSAPPLSESPTDEARRLIAAGYRTEEIARRVRLGRGAIELLRQMKQKPDD